MFVIDNNLRKIKKAWQENKNASGIDIPLPEEFGRLGHQCAEFPDINILPIIEDAEELRDLIIYFVKNKSISRIYLRGFRIKGRFSLEGLTLSGGESLPPLFFIQCLFEGGVCFNSTKLTSLHLTGSRFGVDRESNQTDLGSRYNHINLRSAHIDKKCDLSHIRPVNMCCDESVFDYLERAGDKRYRDDPNSFSKEEFEIVGSSSLVANLSATNFKGYFSASHSCFVEEKPFVDLDRGNGISSYYALTINDCEFNKRVLFDSASFAGGLSAARCKSYSEFWLVGADIYAQYFNLGEKLIRLEVHSLNFQSARFENTLYINTESYESSVQGEIFLSNFNGRDIYMENISFVGKYGVHGDSLNIDRLYLSSLGSGDSDHKIEINSKLKKIGMISFPGMRCQLLKINLENYSIEEPLNNYDLDLNRIKAEEVIIDIGDCESADLNRINVSRIKFSGKINNLLNFYKATINLDLSVIGNIKRLDISEAKLGSLNLNKWATPSAYKDDSFDWNTLNLKKTYVEKSIDLGRIVETQFSGGDSYSLEFLKKDVDLILGTARRVNLSLWKNNKIADQFKEGIFASIHSGGEIIRLNGESSTLYKIIKKYGVDFSSNKKVIDFLCFFCAFVWGSDDTGPFRILTKDLLNPKDRNNISYSEEKNELTIKCGIYEKDFLNEGYKDYRLGDLDVGLVPELRVYRSLKDLKEHYLSRGSINIPVKKNGKYTVISFCDWLMKLDESSNHEEGGYYIPANVIYNKKIFISLFKISLDKGLAYVEMIDDIDICVIDKDFVSEKKIQPGGNQKEQYVYIDMYDYPNFFNRGEDSSVFIEQISDPKFRKPLFPDVAFDKAVKFSNFSFFKRMLGVGREAVVDLSDLQCGLLYDNSGQGWGDYVFFKTDRFHAKAFRRADYYITDEVSIESNKTSLIHSFFLKARDLVLKARDLVFVKSDIVKITDEIDQSPGKVFESKEKEVSFYTKGYGFKEKRLVWLSRYQKKMSSYVNGGEDYREEDKEIDRNIFHLVARNYRRQGLNEAANFIDEARIYRENKERRRKLLRGSIEKKKVSQLLLLFLLIIWNFLNAIDFFESAGVTYICATLFLVVQIIIVIEIRKWILYRFCQLSDFIYFFCFHYGLSLVRPIITIFIFIALGTVGTYYLDRHEFLVLETHVVSPFSAPEGYDGHTVIIPKLYKSEHYIKPTDIACGTTVDHFIYAMDMFIPLIELDQDERCLIRPFDDISPVRQDISYTEILNGDCGRPGLRLCDFVRTFNIVIQHPTTWRFLQSIYVLLGWIIISLTIYIYSTYMKRRSGNSEI